MVGRILTSRILTIASTVAIAAFVSLILGVPFAPEVFAEPDSVQGEVTWRLVSPDLEVAERAYSPGILSSPIVLVRSSLKRYRFGVVRAAEFGLRRAEVKTLCRLAKASVCINANFFDERGAPLGVVVSRGVQHHKLHVGGRTLTGVIESSRQGVRIISRQGYSGLSVLEAVQAGPRLVIEGTRSTDIRDLTRTGRSAVCLDRAQRLIFVASSAGFRGLTFSELQDILLAPNVDCHSALNLDGGGSAQLFVAPHSSPNPSTAEAVSLGGFDQVPVALALFDEQE